MGCACSTHGPASSSATPESFSAAASNDDSVVGHGRAARYRGPSRGSPASEDRQRRAFDVQSFASDGETYVARNNDDASHPHAVHANSSDDGSESHDDEDSVMDHFAAVARSGYAASDSTCFADDERVPAFELLPPQRDLPRPAHR